MSREFDIDPTNNSKVFGPSGSDLQTKRAHLSTGLEDRADENSNMLTDTTTEAKDFAHSNPSFDEKVVGEEPTNLYQMSTIHQREASQILRSPDHFALSTQKNEDATKLMDSTMEDPAAPSTTGDTSGSKEEENPELGEIAREAGLVLDNKLQQLRGLCKTLLNEITVYVEASAKTQAEYLRIQRLEHEESNRLDEVEPDVKGATSHVLEQPFFGSAHLVGNENK